jgi:DNA polymerase III alpha subunit
MTAKIKRTDDWGRVILNPEAAFEIAYSGYDVFSLPMDDSPLIEQFNAVCAEFDKREVVIALPDTPDHSPEEEHSRRSHTWMISDDIRNIEVRPFLISLCKTDDERDRVNEEMDLFEARDLTSLLQLMMYLVDHFRQNKIVWGVGRGSSVASYCLYLIGVHRINSLAYGLSVHDFLKD